LQSLANANIILIPVPIPSFSGSESEKAQLFRLKQASILKLPAAIICALLFITRFS